MTDEKKAALPGGSHYTRPDFSNNAHRGKSQQFNAIADTIRGQEEGARFVRELCDGLADPDAIFMRLREIAEDAAATRGFCRALQKYIERGSA